MLWGEGRREVIPVMLSYLLGSSGQRGAVGSGSALVRVRGISQERCAWSSVEGWVSRHPPHPCSSGSAVQWVEGFWPRTMDGAQRRKLGGRQRGKQRSLGGNPSPA